MYELKRTGFEAAIREYLEEGGVYGGDSAGAVVAGTDLRGIELADEPEFAVEAVYDGMKLVDKFILPHVDNESFADVMKQILKDKKSLKIIQLRDAEYYST